MEKLRNLKPEDAKKWINQKNGSVLDRNEAALALGKVIVLCEYGNTNYDILMASL